MQKYYQWPICAFALLSFVSIALGNVTLGLATLFFLIYIFKNKPSLPQDLKGYFVVIGIFLLSLLASALASGDIKTGLKVWADMRIWRMMPLLIIVFSIKEAYQAKRLLSISMVGIAIGIACLIYQGLSGDHRAAGFFGHPMTFAGYLCIYVPIFMICFLDGKILGKHTWVTGILFFAGCAAAVFNGTRGAWLALAFVMGLILFYYMSQKKLAAILCFILLFGSVMGLTNNRRFMRRVNTITSTRYQSNTERLLIWQSAYKMFQDHPVLGVGLGQYKDNYQQKYISPKAKEPNLGHAHNNFLQMLAENGLVGFFGFVSMIVYFIMKPLLRFWKTRSPYALMISMSTLALILQGLTEYNFGNSAVMKTFWLVLGCLLVLEYKSEKR
ncbi:MAG: O-antigen ligase family protein [Phascolarctobacterium sp.]|nr:O-antigen ligase family protein [Phascolarctobacterium sp.]